MYKEKTLPYSYPRGMIHVLKFDSTIEEPDNYSYFCDVLLSATEDDIVEIYFSTQGGNGDSMITLMNLLRTCRAETHGFLMSSAHSAGSYLLLSCDNIHVGKHVSMLCHQVSYGMAGSHHEVKSYVDHIDKEERRLVQETYKYFLSEDEIESLLNGKQIWLTEAEIIQRLEKRSELFQSESEKAKQEVIDDMFPDFGEELPDEALMKLTKKQLIDYMNGRIVVNVEDNGKISIENVEENTDSNN